MLHPLTASPTGPSESFLPQQQEQFLPMKSLLAWIVNEKCKWLGRERWKSQSILVLFFPPRLWVFRNFSHIRWTIFRLIDWIYGRWMALRPSPSPPFPLSSAKRNNKKEGDPAERGKVGRRQDRLRYEALGDAAEAILRVISFGRAHSPLLTHPHRQRYQDTRAGFLNLIYAPRDDRTFTTRARPSPPTAHTA